MEELREAWVTLARADAESRSQELAGAPPKPPGRLFPCGLAGSPPARQEGGGASSQPGVNLVSPRSPTLGPVSTRSPVSQSGLPIQSQALSPGSTLSPDASPQPGHNPESIRSRSATSAGGGGPGSLASQWASPTWLLDKILFHIHATDISASHCFMENPFPFEDEAFEALFEGMQNLLADLMYLSGKVYTHMWMIEMCLSVCFSL